MVCYVTLLIAKLGYLIKMRSGLVVHSHKVHRSGAEAATEQNRTEQNRTEQNKTE